MKTNKTHISIRSIALLLALVLVVGIAFVVPSSAASSANVGKLADYFQSNNYTFTLNANSRFFLASQPTGELLQTVQLAQRQFASDGIPTSEPMDIVWGDTAMLRAGDIYITIADNDPDIGAEGYKIVAQNYATVTAEDVDGLLYGLNMLQKHFRNAKANSIVGFTTYDTPDTKERTVQLDCARKYLTVDYICNFVKEMSWMGYNTLQLHVSEDGGFRADFWDDSFFEEGYTGTYKPENDFTWICGSHVQSWVRDETDYSLPNYRNDVDAGRFLSTAELFRIIDTCKEYHIDIIPSFDSPAHMDYLNWKFEQNYLSKPSYSFKYNNETFYASKTSGCINYTGTTGSSSPSWPYYTTMDIRDDTDRGKMSQAFVFSIYKDMADFFKIYAGSTKFNIGADEVNLTNPDIYTKVWNYALLPGYLNEVTALLKAKGYSVRMFNDFINSNALTGVEGKMEKLDPDIEILYWNTPYNSITGTSGAYTVNYDATGTYYDSYGYLQTYHTKDPMITAAQYADKGRTLYNCINLHTYYVLRVAPKGKGGSGGGLTTSNGDARSTQCYQWEFYAADEKSIYNKWAPNNFSKKGLSEEADDIVPTANFGGAYFLTWHDYATVSTETAMWNGVEDTVNDSGEVYSVRKRMWSNIIKMWNHDINKSLNFASFATIRNSLGDFPGIKSDTYSGSNYTSTAGTPLPAATDPIKLEDHTALTAALLNKLSKGSYTDESYNAYLNAYNRAILVNNNNSATPEALGQALQELKDAEAALVIKTNSITLVKQTSINGTNYTLETTKYSVPVGESQYEMFVPALNGYKYLRVEGSTFTPAEAGDGSGYLSGNITSDITITMWYENQVDVSRLNNLLADAITEQGNYTDASWRVYSNALANARAFKLTIDTQQATVLALVKALEDARTALVVEADTTFIKVEKLANSFTKGSQVGLHIYTSSNVPNLVITQNGNVVTPDTITGEVQTLTTGETVKYWLVFVPADAVGTFTYTVSYGAVSTSIDVDVV